MKALIVSRIDNRDALAFALKIQNILEQEGCSTVFDSDTAAALHMTGTPVQNVVADFGIIVGGDGTILRTIQQLGTQIPVLGINWGEVGFLADLEPSEALDFIKNIPSGFMVEERMRIALVKEGTCLGVALNEALIVTTRPAKMLRFTIVVDNVAAERFRADGLLISTPTGSTAYAMSAGGPIVDPRIHGFLLVPLAPYMLSSRPHLICSNRDLSIRLESSKSANLVIDGQQTFELGTLTTIDVMMFDKPALFIDVKRNFFEKVDDKLRHL
ncbi:NAD(+)/NADH kinase [Methanoregula sp.]|uniref:NAD(+)/NADH kinase n=1 Tax=Methanoregula sp. TaxID=2052170 RepID=UPI0035623121